MKVLITSGGTEEPIDGVRHITNFSTGRTGAVIADYFFENGADVLLLKGKRACSPEGKLSTQTFTDFNDLDTKLQTLLNDDTFDAVIHLAAVSDFSIDYLEADGKKLTGQMNKLDSSKPLTIHLKPNYKILDRLKGYSKDELMVIGFKLTKGKPLSEVKKIVENMFRKDTVDMVVHNDLTSIKNASHPADIYNQHRRIASTKTKEALAASLLKFIKERLNGTMH